MCGISGFIGSKKNFPSKEKIKALLQLMKRRGPDGHGTFVKKFRHQSFLFAHTRLAIIDLQKKSNQPFEDEKGVISFNGEIYNYIELKDFCIKKGIIFKTQSDTEVLLKMLNLYGEKAITYLDGMWSFSYYDKIKNKVILSRDRFGEKPLYYIKSKDNLIYGSNITYLNLLSKKKIILDKQKVSDFLLLGFKSLGLNQNTIFKNIKTLRPGSTMTINLNKKLTMKAKNFFSVKFKLTFKHSYNEAVGILREKILNIFATRFRSDVPLASLLSGGVDSSSILSVAKKANIKLKCYSIRTKLKEYKEDSYIKTNIKFSKFEHEFIDIPKKNNLKTLKEIVKYQSYPLPTPQAFATALICRKIKFHGYKVMLSGAGGDEFFAGYYHHFLAYLYSIQANKNFNQIHKTWKRKISKYIRSDGMKNFKNFKWNVDNRLSDTSTNQHEEQELKKYVARKINLQTHNKYSNDFCINMILQDVRQNSLRHQLDSLDSIAMFYSIEGRSPFLSSDIFNFLTSLPRDYFFNKCRPKSLLRDALKDYIPKSIFNNLKKVGFYISFKEIFSKKEKRNLYKMITNSNLLKNILNMKEVKKLMKRKNMKHSEAKFLFSAANMAILGDIYDY